MQVEHDDANLEVVVKVGNADERDGDEVVREHQKVVLVPLLDEAVLEARHEPDGHLQQVEQVQRRLGGLAVLRMWYPDVSRRVVPRFGARLDEEYVVLERGH